MTCIIMHTALNWWKYKAAISNGGFPVLDLWKNQRQTLIESRI